MFKRRMGENKPVHLHEFLYPLFQGFDSVALNADVELCGTDQTFNALLGRQLVKTELNKEKFCVIVKLMNHPVTGEPIMSKSKGTGVFLNSDAKTMFGEIMALPDEMIEMVLKWNTTVLLDEIEGLDVKNHPRDAKIFAGEKIVEIFFGKEEALKAKEHFINTFSKSVFPEDAKLIKIGKEEMELFEMLKLCEPLKSNSELRRLISQKAVSVDEEKISDEKKIILINTEKRIRIGKLGFFKITK
ncbi:MAG: Tyrosine--tRNA ligase [Alphaproteobacteria bacterium ADurb.Bin438]|nr:MAG: Tyrosine--tRNA ligase [Alphaproteobacteria bacterium ADurb.Bin438]